MLTKKKGKAIGDCEGQIYPLSRFPFRKLSNLICSAGVRLYILKDFGTNVSFSSILWSQDLSEDTTVHLPLLPPPPTVPDTSLHTNDHSPTYVSDLRWSRLQVRSDQGDEWQSMIYPTNVQCSLPKVLDHMLNDHLISHVIDRPFLLFHVPPLTMAASSPPRLLSLRLCSGLRYLVLG